MIPDSVVESVRCFKRIHPYVGSHDEKIRKFKSVLVVLSHYYSVNVPTLYVTDDTAEMSAFDEYIWQCKGVYDHTDNSISLRKFSIISLLHEFRHHLQFVVGFLCDNTEDDANMWSHVIYKTVWPHNFATLKARAELNQTSIEI